MKPLYWKLLVLLSAIIVGASLIVPKVLRKNQNLDNAHTSAQIKSDIANTEEPLLIQPIELKPIEFGFHEVVQADKLIMRMCLEDKVCPRDKIGYPRKNTRRNIRDGQVGMVLVAKTPVIDTSDLSQATVGQHPSSGTPIINIKMNAVGAKKFCEFTGAHKGNPFAVVLDGKVITTPYINGAICGGSGFIEGGFTLTEAKNIARALNAGTRPVKSRVND